LGLTPEKCLDFQRQNRRKPAVSQALESLDKISCRDKGSAANQERKSMVDIFMALAASS
jgi:hypothetical protein